VLKVVGAGHEEHKCDLEIMSTFNTMIPYDAIVMRQIMVMETPED
jgi:hypothetical protein